MRVLTATLALACLAGQVSGYEPGYERAPILYSETEPDTPLTRIMARAAAGEPILDGKTDREVLGQLLELLEIPIESQVLVYSKTSAQNSRIRPEHPRAIYFSDNAYLGWVQGGEIEAMTFDKELGAIFHLVKLSERTDSGAPTLSRESGCLSCHANSANREVPGGLVRSVYPGSDGLPLFQAGTYYTTPDSPIQERWGGWYVTGNTGEQSHLGNAIAHEVSDSEVTLEKIGPEPISDLSDFINCEPYPFGGSSDVVALMILEHQIAVHNAFGHGGMSTRQTLHRHREIREAFGESPGLPLSETNQGILVNQAKKIAAVLLFADEFVMTDGGVEGSIEFQHAFQANAAKSDEFRSLKDLRLCERLFKYRCSYMVYSDAFHDLPEVLKRLVIDEINRALATGAGHGDYPHLSSGERRHIAQILSETHPDWR